MADEITEAAAWAELDAWRRYGANTRLSFTLKERLMTGAASAFFRFAGRWITGSAQWTVDDPSNVLDDLANRRKGYIVACWHNRMVGLILFFGANYCRRFNKVRIGPLVSESLDGEMIARCVRDIGGENVRGSSSRRGAEGLREAIEEARRGMSIVVTADGPKGPRYELKPGAVMLAKLTGFPIVPYTWTCDRTAQFHRSWDQLLIPLPHAHINIRMGKPYTVPADADARGIARARREIEAQMQQQQLEADAQTTVTWQIPKPRPGERLKKRKPVVVANDKRL